MRYAIMQKMPVPGYWELMPGCYLQEAEYALRLGRCYHDRATKLKGSLIRPLLLYSWEDAQAIIAYHRGKRDYAQFMVMGHIIGEGMQ